MKIKIFALVLVSVLCSTVAFGQEDRSRQWPVSFSTENLRPIEKIESMSPLDREFIRKSIEAYHRSGVYIAGYIHRHLNFTLENSGQWDTLENGIRVWRVTFCCPKATEMAVEFNEFNIPQGAKVFVYSFDKKHIIYHPLTYKDNLSKYSELETFRSFPLSCDTLVLEYNIPANIEHTGKISINAISHGFSHKEWGFQTEESHQCQVNINCPEGVVSNYKKE